jgi:photosystem II stability/assembly factor-like uncharacterized protein/pimeloyl-ACP methyl ester carboxylesterase
LTILCSHFFFNSPKITIMIRPLLSLLLHLFFAYSCFAQLERKPWFGARIESAGTGNTSACKITSILGGTSESLQLQANDLMIRLNEFPLSSSEDFVSKFQNLTVGADIKISLLRNGKEIKVKGKVLPRPYETDDNAEVIYDDAAYKEGRLRVIINKPFQKNKMPAMLFIPGYTCSSIDQLAANHPYKRIIDAYVDAGFVTLRIEKSGLGDSKNTPPCESCDLLDEVLNFETGLKKLKSLPYVDTNRIILVGHSMGGIIAPAISARNNVAGVAVYGTIAKSWFEYQIEITRVQNALEGMNPLAVEQSVREQYALNYRFFIQKEPLESLAKDPGIDSLLKNYWNYDGNGKIFSRNAEYWRQIQDYPLLENWKNTKAKVLVMFGESDFQAFSKNDHWQIVETVNHFHPGNAVFKSFPSTDHYFAKSGSMKEAYDKFAQGKISVLFDEYNPEVGKSLIDWSREVLNQSPAQAFTLNTWHKLTTDKYPGKQDDICFINQRKGWYVNGFGNIYHSADGGMTWTKQWEQKGSFFRCIAFLDSLRGFVGTVGTDYFPGVSDTIPLYKTTDGGKTWMPVNYNGPYVKGLCAIDVVREQIINRGNIDYVEHVYAVGRVGAPANMMVSHDGGNTWTSFPVKEGDMLFDIKMFDKENGIACSASAADISQSNALLLKTSDGGKTWKRVYQSNRPFETTWKVSFPNQQVGYASIQSYNPDTTVKQQRIVKTIDGGNNWEELNLVLDAGAREFGIGFINPQHGFVGTMNSGYETKDGGKTWSKIDLGRACNKIRLYPQPDGRFEAYSIGVELRKGIFENR